MEHEHISRKINKFYLRCINNMCGLYLDSYPIPKDDNHIHVSKHVGFSLVGIIIMGFLMFLQLVGLLNYNFSYFVLCMRCMFSLLNLAQGLSPNNNFTPEMRIWYVKFATVIDAILVIFTIYLLIPVAIYNMIFNVFSTQSALTLMALIKSNILIGFLSNLQTCLTPIMLTISALYGLLFVGFVIGELHMLMFSVFVSLMPTDGRVQWEESIKSLFEWVANYVAKPINNCVFSYITYINNLNNEKIFTDEQLEEFKILLFGNNSNNVRRLAMMQSMINELTHPVHTDNSRISSNTSRISSNTSRTNERERQNLLENQSTSSNSLSMHIGLASDQSLCIEHIEQLNSHTLTENFICSICHETHNVNIVNAVPDVNFHRDETEINSVVSDVTTDENIQEETNSEVGVSTIDMGNYVKLNCSHIFHRNCIRQSILTGLITCPNCRSNII